MELAAEQAAEKAIGWSQGDRFSLVDWAAVQRNTPLPLPLRASVRQQHIPAGGSQSEPVRACRKFRFS